LYHEQFLILENINNLQVWQHITPMR